MKAAQHLAMNCRDPKAQEAFYAKHFGFKRVRTFNPGADEFFIVRLGGMCLEMFQSSDPSAEAGEQTVGLGHLAFEVEKLEPAVAALQADGIDVEPIIDCNELLPGMQVVFFHDPEGNRLELMEGYCDEA